MQHKEGENEPYNTEIPYNNGNAGNIEKIKAYRKSHPEQFFDKKGEAKNGNWSDYDGVNMNTGDLMRIRDLHPVMASDNTHLYTAYISNHPNENDVEIINSGFPVIFETEGSITGIIDSKNIRPLLMLLSKDETVYSAVHSWICILYDKTSGTVTSHGYVGSSNFKPGIPAQLE